MSTGAAPRVSVVLAVRDGAPWVGDAVRSILGQTLSELELIVVDDGSTDDTPQMLASFVDPRMRVARRSRLGLTRSLNEGVSLTRAPLIARLDADDMSASERLARQVAFLDAHPEVGLLGTGATEIDTSGRHIRQVIPPATDADIRHALIRRNVFLHSSVMVRRQVLAAAGGYDATFPVAQDYDLWLRLAAITRMANLSEPLVVRRLLPGRVSATREADRLRAEARVRWRELRAGHYPPWCVVFALRPRVALVLPAAARQAWRRLQARA
jgi:glycosyltransferase involved in cell wall biosynthesis